MDGSPTLHIRLVVCLAIKSLSFCCLRQITAIRTAAPTLCCDPFSPKTLRQHNRSYHPHHDEQTACFQLAGQNANDGADDFRDGEDGEDGDAINDGGASFFDVEAAWKQLEFLVTTGPSKSEKYNGAERLVSLAPSESGSESSHLNSTPNVYIARTTATYSGLLPPPVLGTDDSETDCVINHTLSTDANAVIGPACVSAGGVYIEMVTVYDCDGSEIRGKYTLEFRDRDCSSSSYSSRDYYENYLTT